MNDEDRENLQSLIECELWELETEARIIEELGKQLEDEAPE